MAQDGERSLAVFVDFENLALGFQNRREKFDITRVFERLVEKGKIVFKRLMQIGTGSALTPQCFTKLQSN